MALVTIALVLAALLTAFPPSHRGVIHPDDRNAFVFAQQVRKTGWPAIPYHELDAKNISPHPVFAPIGTKLSPHGYAVTTIAPGIYFLLAPFASSLSASLAWMMVLCLLTWSMVYILLESWFGPKAGLFGWMSFMACSAMLFWSNFLMSNVPALGILASGLFLLTRERPPLRVIGGFLLAVTPLFRFEYAILVFGVGLAWLFANARKRQWRDRMNLAIIIGVSIGLVTVLLVSFLLYGTVNFVSVSRGTGSSLEDTLSGTAANTYGFIFKSSVITFLPLFLVPVLGIVAYFWLERSMTWPAAPLLLSCVTLAAYILVTGFKSQTFLMSNSQTRYLLPLSLAGAIGISKMSSRADWRTLAALGLALALGASGTASLLAGSDGFRGAEASMDLLQQQVDLVSNLTRQDVVIADFLYTDSARVMTTRAIPAEEKAQEVPRAVGRLLDSNETVYLSQRFSGGETRSFLLQDGHFSVTQSQFSGLWLVSRK